MTTLTATHPSLRPDLPDPVAPIRLVAECSLPRRQSVAPAATPEERIAQRRKAAVALDPLVRTLVPRLAPWPLVMQPSFTLYDRIWPATPEVGACWTLTARLFGPLTHSVWSYAVTLCFDERERPHHFLVSGATATVTDDVSEAALAAAIAIVRAGGPLRSESPNALPFVL